MKLTINQAAKATGKAKSTISKATNNGTLSYEKGERGAKLIEKSELFRVFPPTGNDQTESPVANSENEHGNSVLQVELEALRRELETTNLERDRERAQLTSQIEELRDQVKEQRADFRQSLAVLTDQREGQGGKRGFFGLFGRSA